MPEETQQPDYGFIINPGKNEGRGILPASGNKKKRLLIVGALAVVLIIVFSTVFSFIFQDDSELLLTKLAQTHTELVRVSDIGKEKARSSQVRDFATTTKATLTSSEQEIMGIVSGTIKVDSKLLAASKNPETDERLTVAEQRNQFDEVYIELISEQMQDYRSQLQNLHNLTSSEKNKEIYSKLFNDLGALLASLEKPE